MKMNSPKILYFIGSAVPTAEDIEAAHALGHNTVFRNAAHVGFDPIEACDGVSGKVPDSYAAKYKDGAEVLAAFRALSAVKAPVVAPQVPPAVVNLPPVEAPQTAPAVGVPGMPPFGPPVV